MNAKNPHGWLSFVADVDPQAIKGKWRSYEMVKGKTSGWHTQKCQQCLQSASCVRRQRVVPELASPQPHIPMIFYLTSKWLIGKWQQYGWNGPSHSSVILLWELEKSCKKADFQIYQVPFLNFSDNVEKVKVFGRDKRTLNDFKKDGRRGLRESHFCFKYMESCTPQG